MSSIERLLLRLLEEDHEGDHDHGADEFLLEDEHHDDHDDDDKPWGDAIGAAILIQLVTLTGLFFSIGVTYYSRLKGNHKEIIHFMAFKVIPSFACGALLATSVFLVIPESLILLGGGHAAHDEHEHEHEEDMHNDTAVRFLEEEEEEAHEDEHNDAEVAWKFGAALLGGFVFPILMSAFFPTHSHGMEDGAVVESAAAEEVAKINEGDHQKSSESDDMADQEVNVDDVQDENATKTAAAAEDQVTEKTEETSSVAAEIDWTLASSILLGDFFHNFTDGVFVGTAFLLCSRSVAYTIVATTIYHELAQEIADFALLHHHCGFSMFMAAFYNFVSGFSVMIGVIVVLSIDMSEVAQGTTLAIAAGVYIYIAACECVPRIQAVRKGPRDTLVFLVAFILGAVPIGLVLLNHQHCEAGHEDHDEEGEVDADHDH